MFNGVMVSRGAAMPTPNDTTPPVGWQVISGSTNDSVIVWRPNKDTTSGTRVWRVQYAIETGVGTGVYTTATNRDGSALALDVAFPRTDTTALVAVATPGAVANDNYGDVVGCTYRARLVYPTSDGLAAQTAWVDGVAAFPVAWVSGTPANVSAVSDNGQVTSNPDTMFHDFGYTLGSTVDGYVTTGYSNVSLELRITRVRNGVPQNTWGIFGLTSGDLSSAVVAVHPRDGATWDYTMAVYVRVAPDPSELGLSVFDANDFAVATGAVSSGVTIATVTGSV